MNYEELLNAKSGARAKQARMPIGVFSKKEVDGKYHNVLDIDGRFGMNIKFSEALKEDCAKNRVLSHKHQLHFEPVEEGGDIVRLNIDSGNYETLAQLLEAQPSLVAEKGFVDNIISQLLDLTEYLHEKGVWHVCYAPQNILIRKGDNAVMLLSHSSFYLNMSNPMELFEGVEDYIAPEVKEKGAVDNRCDIYSLGKLISYLFQLGSFPYEYKKVSMKAQKDVPEDRYQTVDAMRKALAMKRGLHQSFVGLLIAVAAALLVLGLYFGLMPETTQVEFINPTPQQAADEPLDKGFDPAELGIVSGDSTLMSEEQRRQQAEYEAKAEQIFKKRFMEEADRLLSKIYDNEHMNASEKKFMSDMSDVNEKLLKLQSDLGEEAGISNARSQLLATQIVERLTEQKKKQLQYHGIQKKKK